MGSFLEVRSLFRWKFKSGIYRIQDLCTGPHRSHGSTYGSRQDLRLTRTARTPNAGRTSQRYDNIIGRVSLLSTHTWAALSDIDLDLFGRNNTGNLRLTTTRPPRVATSSSIRFAPRSLTGTSGFLKRSNFGGLGMMFVGGCCVHRLEIGET